MSHHQLNLHRFRVKSNMSCSTFRFARGRQGDRASGRPIWTPFLLLFSCDFGSLSNCLLLQCLYESNRSLRCKFASIVVSKSIFLFLLFAFLSFVSSGRTTRFERFDSNRGPKSVLQRPSRVEVHFERRTTKYLQTNVTLGASSSCFCTLLTSF
jgi:hypothetical protein